MVNALENIKSIINQHQKIIQSLYNLMPAIQRMAEKMIFTLKNGGTVFWMGNGGSAADAQHMATELMGRFMRERQALASIALTTDSSLLTALSNDYTFSDIFSRQLAGLCKSNDMVIGLSTSGNSENVLQGINTAKKIGAYTVGLTGCSGGKLAFITDHCLKVDSEITARIQEAHTLLCHIVCELIDQAFA